MLAASAVCPSPPLLVPDVAGGAAPELDPLRAACRQALDQLAAARPDRLTVVAADGRRPEDAEEHPAGGTRYPAGSTGSFADFGVPLTATLGAAPAAPAAPADPAATLPPALAVAAWLLADAGWSAAPVTGLALGATHSAADCQAVGRKLAAEPGRTALLVMGDGSACRTLKAPGYLDPRAEGFDAEIARALDDADTAALAGLDVRLAAELKAAGRPGWQLLAGAAEGAGLSGRLRYHEAPYGVGYFVASWS